MSIVKFRAKGEIEVPIPANVTVIQSGFFDKRRVKFVVEYDAENPVEADAFLRDTIRRTAEMLLASVASNQEPDPASSPQPTGLEGRGNDLPASFYGPDIDERDLKTMNLSDELGGF